MRRFRVYFLLLACPLLFFSGCDGDEPVEPSVSYAFSIAVPEVSAETANFNVSYAVNTADDPTVRAGITYTVQGGSDYTDEVAAEVADGHFSVTLTGLEPETQYIAYAFAETADGGRYLSASGVNFTTLSDPYLIPQYTWAELPVITEMDNVLYVTHYVTADGQSLATSETAGRVRNYTICYDENRLQSLWVAYPMHAFYDGDSGRTSSWYSDPDIPSSVQQPDLSSSYKPSNQYSRGHQIASADRQRSSAMNRQTFYYTNSTPQIQNRFNASIWSSLESRVQGWGFNWADTLYVVTGPAFIEDRGTIDDNSSEPKAVPVASHFFKVLLSSKSGNTGMPISQLSASELRCVGFWLEHMEYTNGTISSAYMSSVAEIEDKTGFSFFPMLSEEARSVKDSYDPADWGM